MALGYHKLNTSAARSRPANREIEIINFSKFAIISEGDIVEHVKLGLGVSSSIATDMGDIISVIFNCTKRNVRCSDLKKVQSDGRPQTARAHKTKS
jgi:hypothetical protein